MTTLTVITDPGVTEHGTGEINKRRDASSMTIDTILIGWCRRNMIKRFAGRDRIIMANLTTIGDTGMIIEASSKRTTARWCMTCFTINCRRVVWHVIR